MNLSERGLADDKLIHLLSNTPERSFVLIEDVDAAFNKRVQTSADGYVAYSCVVLFHGLPACVLHELIPHTLVDSYQSSVTFSGFLNALDGVASGEERIIFMTTNHPEQLDPALIRPGRVDLSLLIGDATPEQARRLFERFYGGGDGKDKRWGHIEETELDKLGREVEEVVEREMRSGRKVSMAALQGLFIRSSAVGAVRDLKTILVQRGSESSATMS